MRRSHRLTIAALGFTLHGSASHPLTAQATAASIVESMKNELKALVTAQEAHFADWATYASAVGQSQEKGVASFKVPAGRIIVLSNVSQYGWTGVMSSPTSTVTCGVYVGEAKNAPNPAVKREAAPACWGEVANSTAPPTVTPGSAEPIIASMKTDLRNLVVSQEAYFADFSTYAARLGPEPKEGTAYFLPSRDNRVELSNVSLLGWTAVITNSGSTITCGIFIGPARNAPNAAVIQEGAPGCW